MSDGFFKFFFFLVASIAFAMFMATAYLAVTCYTGGDPNSMACYMMSQRHEIGIRQR